MAFAFNECDAKVPKTFHLEFQASKGPIRRALPSLEAPTLTVDLLPVPVVVLTRSPSLFIAVSPCFSKSSTRPNTAMGSLSD
jgi:hypothetical protein